MSGSEIGIKIGLTGAEAVQSQLAKVEQAMGGVDAQTVRVADAFQQLGGSTAGIGNVSQAMAQYTQQTRDARVEANLLRQANRQLAVQMTDVVTSLASGMPAWMVFIQQGGQIKDSYGGIGQAIQGVTGYLRTLINPLTLAGTAFAAVGAAAFMGSREMDAYVKALTLSGNAAGTTAGALDQMAARLDSVAGTQSKAAEVLAQLAESGNITAASLERVALAAIQLERAGGPAVQETAKQFAALAKDPLAASIKLNESTRFLTLSVYEQVKALESQGRSAEAATTAMEAYAKVVEQRTQVLEDQLGYIEKGWRAVKDGAKEAWDAMLGLGRQDSLEKQLQTVRDQLAQRTSAQDTARSDNKARYQPAIDALRLQEAFLQEQLRLQARGITLDAERAAMVKARAEWDKKGSQYLSDQQKMQKEITEAQRLGLEGKIAQAEVERRIAAIRASYAGKGGTEGLSDEAKATGEAVKVREKYLETLSLSAEKMVKENQTMAEQVAQMVLGKQAFQDIISAREEEQAVLLETQAIRAMDRNLDAKEYDSLKAQAAAIRERISVRQALATATVEAADREIMARRGALKDQDAQEIIDTQRLKTSQGLIDAIERETAMLQMSNVEREVTIALLAAEARGIKAGTYEYDEYAKSVRAAIVNRETVRDSIEQTRKIEDEWRRTTDQIGQSLSDALMQGGKSAWEYIKGLFRSMVFTPVIRAIVRPVAGAFAGAFGLPGAASAATAMGGAGGGLGGLLSSGMSLLNGSTIGSAFGNAGAFGADALGNWLVNNTTGSLNSLGGSLMGNAGMLGNMAGMAGNAFAGYGISKALSGGYSAGGAVNTIAGLASAIPGIGPIAGVVGGLVNRAFGMKAKEMRDSGIVGSLSGGAATGQQFQDWFQKGGWFRSNKSGTNFSALGDDTSAALNAGALSVLDSTRAWAQALKLPGDALSSVTTQFKVKLTGDATKDQAEIQALFTRYAADLATTFQGQLAPFQRAGEAISDTLQRLAGLQKFSEAINEFGGVFSRVANLSVDAREQLLGFAGGMEAFVAKTQSFAQNYYEEAELAGIQARQVRDQLAGMGINAQIFSRADFRRLVEGTDVSNEQGRQRLSQLLTLGEAFAPVGRFLESNGGSLNTLANMAPTTGVVQQLLGGNSMAGLSSLTDATTAGTNATVSTLERLISRVGELETALVKALDKSGRAVADSVYYDPGWSTNGGGGGGVN
jgi:phage-related minor tail protein